jgi:hypothetical protein
MCVTETIANYVINWREFINCCKDWNIFPMVSHLQAHSFPLDGTSLEGAGRIEDAVPNEVRDEPKVHRRLGWGWK